MSTPVLWILDDSDSVVYILRWYLQRMGYLVRQVQDSAPGIAEMIDRSSPHDAFLIDNKLATSPGIDICLELRKKYENAESRVFLVSAYIDPEIADQAIKQGVVCIPKDTKTIDTILKELSALRELRTWQGLADAGAKLFLAFIARQKKIALGTLLIVTAAVANRLFGMLDAVSMWGTVAVAISCGGALALFSAAYSSQKKTVKRYAFFLVACALLIEAVMVISWIIVGRHQ